MPVMLSLGDVVRTVQGDWAVLVEEIPAEVRLIRCYTAKFIGMFIWNGRLCHSFYDEFGHRLDTAGDSSRMASHQPAERRANDLVVQPRPVTDDLRAAAAHLKANPEATIIGQDVANGVAGPFIQGMPPRRPALAVVGNPAATPVIALPSPSQAELGALVEPIAYRRRAFDTSPIGPRIPFSYDDARPRPPRAMSEADRLDAIGRLIDKGDGRIDRNGTFHPDQHSGGSEDFGGVIAMPGREPSMETSKDGTGRVPVPSQPSQPGEPHPAPVLKSIREEETRILTELSQPGSRTLTDWDRAVLAGILIRNHLMTPSDTMGGQSGR